MSLEDEKRQRTSSRTSDDHEDDEPEERVRLSDHIDMKQLQDDAKNSTTSTTSTSTPTTQPNPDHEETSILGHPHGFFDVRVAVVGNVDSGKSTLIGVLTGGVLDNGRGLARSKVFIHQHEQNNGRTSCISQHIMGFDTDSKPVHQPVAASASSLAKTKSWKEVVSKSRSVVTFIDLAGHESYLKTTIAGLTGCFPDYALVIINSLAGVTKMTKEHLGVVLALEIPLACVVTKIDMVPENVLDRTRTQLFKILKSPAAGKMPLHMRNEKDIETVVNNPSERICPVFFISSVAGTDLPLLTHYLSTLRPRADWQNGVVKKTEFNIDETFNVTGVGIVISGTVSSGVLTRDTTLLMGPHSDGSFRPVLVRTIHCKRVPVESCEAGSSCAVSLRAIKRKEVLKRNQIRRGMVLVDPESNPISTRTFEAEVLVLHHPTTIKLSYQAVIHAGIIRQTAAIVSINRECLRTGDKALVRFRFLLRDEYLHPGTTFIFREGNTKGIGKIVRTQFTPEELAADQMHLDSRHKKNKPVTITDPVDIENGTDEKQQIKENNQQENTSTTTSKEKSSTTTTTSATSKPISTTTLTSTPSKEKPITKSTTTATTTPSKDKKDKPTEQKKDKEKFHKSDNKTKDKHESKEPTKRSSQDKGHGKHG